MLSLLRRIERSADAASVVASGLLIGTLIGALSWGYITYIQTSFAANGVPQTVAFQGKLTDDNGLTVADGNYTMRFAIYDASSGGTCLYSAGNDDADTGTIDCTGDTPDTGITVAVTDGIFSVLLGDTGQNTLVPNDIFSGTSDRFLGITVDPDAEMTPRIQIGSTPNALNADQIDGFDVSQTGGNAVIPATDADGDFVLTAGTNNRIGIGTASPSEPLHIFSTDGNVILQDSNHESTEVSMQSYISILDASGDETGFVGIAGAANNDMQIGSAAGDLTFFARDTIGGATERMRIDGTNGNVGINTTTPGSILHLFDEDGVSNVLEILRVERLNDVSAGAAGLGGAIDFYLEDDGSNSVQSGRFAIEVEDATAASTDARFSFSALINDSLVELMRLGTDANGSGTNSRAVEIRGASDTDERLKFYLADDDIAHGVTDILPADVYGSLEVFDGNRGGVQLIGVNDAAANNHPVLIRGIHDSSTSNSAVAIRGGVRSGTGVGNVAATTAPIFQVQNSDATEYFSIMGDGQAGVLTDDPQAALHVSVDGAAPAAALLLSQAEGFLLSSENQNNNSMQLLTANDGTNDSSDLFLVRAGGTLATPTAVGTGDDVGVVQYGGYDGSALQRTAAIRAEVAGSVSSGVLPMRLEFDTGATNTASRTTRMTIDQTGNVGIADGTPDAVLDVRGDMIIEPTGTGTVLDLELETEWTAGTLVNADFGSATTQTGDITGVSFDFNTNLTAAEDLDITGLSIQTPAITSTSAATTTDYIGLSLGGGTLTSDTAAADNILNYSGVYVNVPALDVDGASGDLNAYGVRVDPTSAGGSPRPDLIGFQLDDHGGGFDVTGINLPLSSGAGGTETGISFGDGWDTEIRFGVSPNISMLDTGTLSFVQSNDTLLSLADIGTVGALNVTSSTSDVGELRFLEDTDGGTNYVGFSAADSTDITSNVIWELPIADGSNGQALTTNGSGVLSFTTIGGGGSQDFDDVYAESITGGNLIMEIDNAGGLTYNLTTTGDFIIQDGGSTFATFDDSGNVAFENNVDLGSDSSDTISVNGEIDTTLVATGTSIDLGTDADRWGELFLSGATLHLGASGDEGTIAYDTTGNELEFNGGSGINMVIETGGNVGIGTESPSAQLEVSGAVSADELSNFIAASATTNLINDFPFLSLVNTNTTANNYAAIGFKDAVGGSEIGRIVGVFTDHSNEYGDLAFITRGASGIGERMRIDEDGNVGIGTTSPETIFHVEDDARVSLRATTHSATASDSTVLGLQRTRGTESSPTVLSDNDLIGAIEFQGQDTNSISGSATILVEVDGTPNANAAPGAIVFQTNDASGSLPTERVRIDNDGNVGIGTTSPSDLLQVSGATNGTLGGRITNTDTGTSALSTLYMGNSTSETDVVFFGAGTNYTALGGARSGGIGTNSTAPFVFLTAGAERMRIDSSGNVGIGTGAPSTDDAVDFELAREGDSAIVRFTTYSNTLTDYPVIAFEHFGGTEASHASTPSGATLGDITFAGDAGGTGGSDQGARIHVNTTEAWTGSAAGSELFVSTVPNGQLASVERMHIEGDGDIEFDTGTLFIDTSASSVGIGTSSPSVNLHVAADAGSLPTLSADAYFLVNNSSAAGDSAIMQVVSGNTGVAGLAFGDTDDDIRGYLRYDNNLDELGIWSNNRERLVLDDEVTIQGDNAGAIELRFAEDLDLQGNYVGFKAADSLAGNQIWTLPSADGTNGQALTTNGSGVLSFTTVGGGSPTLDDAYDNFGGGSETITVDSGTLTWNLSGANDEFLIQDGGSAAFIVDDSGNVGIGTASPGQELEVNFNQDNFTDILVANANTGTSAGSGIQASADSSSFSLRAYGDAYSDAELVDTVSLFTSNSSGLGLFSAESGGEIKFYTGGSGSSNRRMTIDGDGDVGIGTTSPGQMLHLDTATDDGIHIESLSDAFIILEADTNNAGGEDQNPYIGLGQDAGNQIDALIGLVGDAGDDPVGTALTGTLANALYIGGASADKVLQFAADISAGVAMTLDDTNFLGIGTNAPAERFHVRSDGDFQARFQNADTGGGFWNIGQSDNAFAAGGGKLLFVPDSATSTDATVTFENAGDVGIGTTNPTSLLHMLPSSGNSDLHIESAADAFILLEADNNDATETDNPYIEFSQDGGTVQSIIGHIGNIDGASPISEESITGTLANAFVIANTASAQDLQFGTDNAIRMTIDETGNVGIGTVAPAVALDIADAGNGGRGMRVTNSDTGTSARATYISQNDNGDQSIFGIQGSNYSSGGTFFDVGSAGTINSTGAGGFILGATDSAGDIVFGTGGSASANERARFDASTGVIFNDPASDYDFTIEGTSDANLFFVDAGNNRVGISTATPGATLDVDGSAIFNNSEANVDFRVAGDTETNLLYVRASADAVGIGTTNPDGRLHSALATDGDTIGLILENSETNTDASLNETTSLNFGFGGIDDAGIIRVGKEDGFDSAAEEDSFMAFYTNLSSTPTERMRITSTGEFGFRTSAPAGQVEFELSESSSTGFFIDYNVRPQTVNMFHLDIDGDGAIGDATGDAFKIDYDNVIVGGPATATYSTNTVDVARTLELDSTGSTLNITGALARFTETATETDGTVSHTASVMELNHTFADSDGHGLHITMETVAAPSSGSLENQALVLDVNEAANNDDVFIIRSDADGTADTEFLVELDGNTFADGAYSGAGADYAEFFDTDDATLSAGELVCHDPVNADHVVRCSSSGHVIGAISTNPGFIGNNGGVEDMRETDPNYALVGLFGQVDVDVNDTNGAIAIGDAITLSSTAGVGAKATKSGFVVGYALEAHASGTGTINVMVEPGFYAGADFELGATGTADATTTEYDSHTLGFRGSAWDGAAAVTRDLSITNVVTDDDNYRLSITDNDSTEVAYINNEGDLAIAGRFYPSAEGTLQTDKYIYYDPNGVFDAMRTNADSWGSGSYDFAEMFPSLDQLEPGDVVVFGDDPESVKKSRGVIYDEKIAGIVSTKPGFIAGNFEEGHHPIALAGRVPTKVSTENGEIEIGDPLTTSSTNGTAMKATEPGAIIGYALEPYNGEGENKIVVFVNASYYGGGGANPNAGTENEASGLNLSGSGLSSLDMYGPIYMHGNDIIEVHRITGLANTWQIDPEGVFTTKGSVEVVTESYQLEDVTSYAVLSREHKITLSGSAQLENGRATVNFENVDPAFNDITALTADVRVQVTLRGAANGIYVDQADHNGFSVIELNNGSSDAPFDWFVEAYRKDYEPVEEEEVPVEEEPPIEEPPVEDPPDEVPPEEEPPVEEPPTEEPPVEEPPAEDPPIEEPPVEDPPIEEPPIEDPPVEDPPAEDPPASP